MRKIHPWCLELAVWEDLLLLQMNGVQKAQRTLNNDKVECFYDLGFG
ncbi:hypothetical protein DsansV1_C35g0227551 [Dioscorea sansibarensis]